MIDFRKIYISTNYIGISKDMYDNVVISVRIISNVYNEFLISIRLY